jgi:hypothetical protein
VFVLQGVSTKAVEGGSAVIEIIFSIISNNKLGKYLRVDNNRTIQKNLCTMQPPALEIFR